MFQKLVINYFYCFSTNQNYLQVPQVWFTLLLFFVGIIMTSKQVLFVRKLKLQRVATTLDGLAPPTPSAMTTTPTEPQLPFRPTGSFCFLDSYANVFFLYELFYSDSICQCIIQEINNESFSKNILPDLLNETSPSYIRHPVRLKWHCQIWTYGTLFSFWEKYWPIFVDRMKNGINNRCYWTWNSIVTCHWCTYV